MQNQSSFSSRLNRTILLPIALLAFLAGILLLETHSLTSAMQRVDHTDQVIGQSRRLIRHIADMEAGLRGYQLTGSEEFLESYNKADGLVDSDFSVLSEFISDDPRQLQRLELVRADFTQWRGYAVRTIARLRNGEKVNSYEENVEARRLIDTMREGKGLMDTLRQEREKFVAQEEQVRNERVRRANRLSNFALSSSVLLTFTVGGLVIFLTRRQMSSLVESFRETADAAEHRAAELGRLSAIVESSEDAIIGKTLDGTITSWNRSAEQMYGYTAAEVLGKPMNMLMAPEHTDELPGILQRLARGEHTEHYETVRRRKDGTLIDVAVSISPILDQAGTIIGASSIARDITERKRAEEELRRSERRLSLALKAGHSGTFDWDIKTDKRFWSDDMFGLYGVKREDFAGGTEAWLNCVVPEDREAASTALMRSLKTGEFAATYRIRRRNDGEVRWIEASGQLSLDGRGEPARVIGINTDITERKRAEEALRASEERLRLLGDNLPNSVVYQTTDDPDGKPRFLYMSAGIERANGVKAEDVLKDSGVLFRQLLPGEAEAFLEAKRASARNLSVFEREIQMRLPDGQLRWKHLVARPRRLPDGRVIWDGVQSDITERKHNELALRESEQELRKLSAALITAEEDAARQISRELHDDIAQRLALLSMEIGKTAARRPEAEDLVHELRSQQAKILDISEGIRKISHEMHPSILDDLGLSAALESMCLDLQKVEKTRVHFEAKQIPDNLDRALASCLYRVCQECLRNVSKHAKANNINVVLTQDGGFVQLEVLDSGVGFESTERKTGLGMYSMKERLRLVHGTVSIESQPGHGTRVLARVPLKVGTAETHAYSAGK
jgi:PAS domain S-box-containing protein